ncbi:MAG: ribokinase [Elainellaceae cyanobacterium]
MTVIVFGSINMDLVARSPRLPMPGETIIGHQFETIPGGKGANQAVAVARLGIPTQMVGRVGGDSFGHELIAKLHESGVGCDRIVIDSETTSGIAVIEVDDRGENHIVIISGANSRVDATDIERLRAILPGAHALMLQLEIPLASVIVAAHAAHDAGVPVILDPAPARANLPLDLYPLIDILTPNQIEASQLVGFPVDHQDTATQAAHILRDRGVGTVIVKLGRAGALCVTGDDTFHVPAFVVNAVDTVAAGDAFNGGLAAALATGRSLRDAVAQACAVGALSVTKFGAQPSMPSQAELNAFLRQH